VTDQLDGPAPVDYALVKQIRVKVNSAIEDHESASGTLNSEQQKLMAANLIMRELETHTFTTASAGGRRMTAPDELAVRDVVMRQMFGLGAIEALLENGEIEDVYICGADPVTVKFFGGRKEVWPAIAEDDDDLLNQIKAIATHQGMNERDITAARPFLNMDLPGFDARLGLLFGVTPHPIVTIRRHRFVNVQLEHLVQWGTISRSMMAFLHAAVVGRRSILIVGPQSGGKTTMLRALAQCISSEERFATLETEFELLLHTIPGRFPLLVPVEERVGGGEKDSTGKPAGEVNLSDVFPWTLRHSLERVLVGECRSHEVVSLIRAMSRGYRGSMATFHADTPAETFESLASLLTEHSPQMSHEAAMRAIATALDLIVFIDREAVFDRDTGEPTEIRFVSDIIEVGPVVRETGRPEATRLFEPATDDAVRELDPRGYPTGAHPTDPLWARRAGLDLEWLSTEHGRWDRPFPRRGLA